MINIHDSTFKMLKEHFLDDVYMCVTLSRSLKSSSSFVPSAPPTFSLTICKQSNESMKPTAQDYRLQDPTMFCFEPNFTIYTLSWKKTQDSLRFILMIFHICTNRGGGQPLSGGLRTDVMMWNRPGSDMIQNTDLFWMLLTPCISHKYFYSKWHIKNFNSMWPSDSKSIITLDK